MEHNLFRYPYTLTSTTLLRLGQVTSSIHANDKRRSLYVVVQSTIPIFTTTPTYVYSHILFQKKFFKKTFGPFPRVPGAQHPHFRISLPTPNTLGFFPASPAPFTPAAKRQVLTSNVAPTPNLQRQPTRPSSSRKFSGLNHRLYTTHLLLYHGLTKALVFKFFWALSQGSRGSTPAFSDYPPRATYPAIFFPPRLLIFNNRFYSGTPNFHRYPYFNAIFGFSSSRYLP